VPSGTQATRENDPSHDGTPTGEFIYNKYYKEPTNRILLPLFFVSPLSPSTGEKELIHIGVNWIRNPHNQNVSRPNRMARNNLRYPNGHWENDHSSMARALLHESFDKTGIDPQETICIRPILLFQTPIYDQAFKAREKQLKKDRGSK
jgi:hypothetical protein